MKAVVVGGGLTGATAAGELARNGFLVTVYEAEDGVGGNVRTSQLGGLTFERFGPHIFHTDRRPILDIVEPYLRPYVHTVESITDAGLLSWPPQIEELRKLYAWPEIRTELANRPELPDANMTDFETYAVALMGRTLYNLFIRDYTAKQWGRPAHELSATFAPKRIDLRDDGDRRLFRSQPQGWFEGERYINDQLADCAIILGERLTTRTLPLADAYVVTAPLDDFLGVPSGGRLEWRGVSFRHELIRGTERAFTAAVTNFPTPTPDYTRVTEAKWMTGEQSPDTVLSWEYSGSDARFYPVNDRLGINRGLQRDLEDKLKREVPNALPAGRLARYVYIDMDQAIGQGLNVAKEILRRTS